MSSDKSGTRAARFGGISIIIAGVLWGMLGLFVRTIGKFGMTSMQMVFMRVFVTMCTLGIVILIKDKKAFRIKLCDIWCFIGTGIVSIVMFTYFYFTTIQAVSMSSAAVLLYTAPVFVMFFSAILFKEKINTVKITACVLAFLGCVFTSGILGGGAKIGIYGLCTGILSGIGYAMYSIFGRYAINKGYGSLTITFYTFLFSSIGVLPFIKFTPMVRILSENSSALVLCILMGIVSAAVPYLLYTLGLESVESSKASILASVEPLAATIAGAAAFNEKLSIYSVLGVGFILSAVILLSVKRKEKK